MNNFIAAKCCAIFCFLHFTYFSFSQQNDINIIDSNGLKQGKWIGKYENNKKKYEGNFKNNYPIGTFVYFYESGDKNAEIEFYDNGKKSKAKYFYQNGKLMGKGNYIEQKKDSVWLYYDDREILSAEENFSNGTKQGISKIFFLDGTVSEEKNWRNGIEHGLCKQYFQTGKLKYEANYADGNPDGKVTYFHISGQIKSAGIYADAVKDGTWISYHEDGSVYFVETFLHGRLFTMEKENGIFKEHYPSGSLKEEITYKNGNKNGVFKEYYDVKTEPIDTAKKQTEEWETLYNDKKIFDDKPAVDSPIIKQHGNFLNNQLDGDIIYYKENGAVEKVETYKEGTLIKKK